MKLEKSASYNTIQIRLQALPGSPWLPSIPKQGSHHARGFDVCAYLPNGPVTIFPLQTVVIPTGLYLALPEGSAMLVCSRSGMAMKGMIVANAPGIIDSDYRGECNVILTYLAVPAPRILGPAPTDGYKINHGDRIAQWVYLPPVLSGPLNMGIVQAVVNPTFEEVAELPDPESDRTGGFGSTGV